MLPEESSDAAGGRTVVRLSGVTAGFAGAEVLRGVDFEAHAGAVALVTGATAAGKSSLVHLLRLALRPRGGHAMILGADAGRLSARQRARLKRRIGYVAETPVFVERWSAFDNIALPLRLAGRKAVDYADDVRELISFVGLNAGADEPAWRLSAVERRRVAIARALAAKPDLIVADAPTAGLARDAAFRIVRLLAELRRVGAAVVLTSQDEAIADGVQAQRWRIALGRLTKLDGARHAEAAE